MIESSQEKEMKSQGLRCPICNRLAVEIGVNHREKLYFSDVTNYNNIFRCQNCDFIFRGGLPNANQMDVVYRDVHPPSWPTDKYRWLASRQIEILDNYLETKENPRILDVGGGKGVLADCLSKRGYNLTVLEPNKDAFNEVSPKHRKVNKKLEDWSTSEKFDFIIVSHVLEHILDINLFMQTLDERIQSNGYIYIEVPGRNHEVFCDGAQKSKLTDKIVERNVRYFCKLAPVHLYSFNKKTLSALAEKHGFSVVEYGYREHGLHKLRVEMMRNNFRYINSLEDKALSTKKTLTILVQFLLFRLKFIVIWKLKNFTQKGPYYSSRQWVILKPSG